MGVELYPHQKEALPKMKNGCILVGGVGSGKSRTSLAYYFTQEGGRLNPYSPMKNPRDLYIITTARKRDELDWEGEMVPFLLQTEIYPNNVVIDSWNNIKKYIEVKNAFFIFDEQRVVGYGAWTRSFLKITKQNKWILLSATPGDVWLDYVPVFIANGFYRNKTEFTREHCVYSRYTKYPKVERYINTGKLLRYRNQILVPMEDQRHTVQHHEDVYCKYDIQMYKDVGRFKKDPFKPGYIPCNPNDEAALLIGKDVSLENVNVLEGWPYKPKNGDYVKLSFKPIKTAAELCGVWRKIVNTDESRQMALLEIFENHPKMIVFYNFDYELEILKGMYYGDDVIVAEWNGHKHEPVPDAKTWVYLVQFTAGAEGWNCIETDTTVFFSQNYSYKIMQQASGRIDRLNTPYRRLYYYHLKTRSGIDLAISRALREKRNFNESKFVERR